MRCGDVRMLFSAAAVATQMFMAGIEDGLLPPSKGGLGELIEAPVSLRTAASAAGAVFGVRRVPEVAQVVARGSEVDGAASSANATAADQKKRPISLGPDGLYCGYPFPRRR